MSIINIIYKSRVIGLRFISSCASGNTPVKLSYTIYNQETSNEKTHKSPIVLMHGVFDSRNNFISLSKALNQLTRRTIITPDCRNHGDSPHASELSFPATTEDLKYLIENLKLKQSVLMGHSMGGGTAMFTALTYPHLVEKLVVIEANPIETSQSIMYMHETARDMAAITFQGIQTLSEARKHADQLLSASIKSPTVREFLTKNLREKSPGNFKWILNLPVLIRDCPKYITKFPTLVPQLLEKPFTKPTLYIGGGQSDWLRKKHFEDIRKLFPNAEFTRIENAGHYVHLQRPAEFLKISSEFINA